jgi:hypothetical protein
MATSSCQIEPSGREDNGDFADLPPQPIADFTACIEIVSAGIPGLRRFAHDRGGGV